MVFCVRFVGQVGNLSLCWLSMLPDYHILYC